MRKVVAAKAVEAAKAAKAAKADTSHSANGPNSNLTSGSDAMPDHTAETAVAMMIGLDGVLSSNTSVRA